MTTIPVTIFNGGMTADARDTASFSQLCKHFDNFTAKHKLIPYRDSEDAYAGQSTFQGKKFLMSSSGDMYIFGRQTANNRPALIKNSNIATPSISIPANADSSTETNVETSELFIEYKNVIYGADVDGLWSYSGSTWTEDEYNITFTSMTQGLVHSKDSILYFGYTNSTAAYIAKKDGAAAFATALTIPTTTHKIVSLCEYGNYLAIGFAPLSIDGNSFVILWDRDSTVNDVSETIDLGNRSLCAIENIDGYLIAVSLSGNTNMVLRPKMVFQKYAGGGFQVFREIPLASGVNVITGKQKVNNRMYFGLTATSQGYTDLYDYVGIWSVGRNGETEPFSVNFIQLANNNLLPQAIKGFIIVNDYFYISYLDGLGNYGMSKTNDQASYTATSVYRTVINPNMPEGDKVKKKKLQSVALTYEKLPANGQIVLKYRVDGGSWVTVFTETTDNRVITEMPSANGTSFTDGRDYEFEIQSTGGAEITGLFYKYIPLETLI
jgi:hypothetical protein